MFNIFIYFTCLQVSLSHIVLLHQERHFVLEGGECASVGGEGVSVRWSWRVMPSWRPRSGRRRSSWGPRSGRRWSSCRPWSWRRRSSCRPWSWRRRWPRQTWWILGHGLSSPWCRFPIVRIFRIKKYVSKSFYIMYEKLITWLIRWTAPCTGGDFVKLYANATPVTIFLVILFFMVAY